MSTGIRLTDKESSATVASLVGIRTSPTRKVTPILVDDLAEQLLGGPIGESINGATAGYNWKDAVRVATTGPVNLASGLVNGTVIDGVAVVTNDRVLVKSQAAQAQNGIYVVPASGTASRATDADTADKLRSMTVFVIAGTTNGGKQFSCPMKGDITVGTTPLPFIMTADQSALNANVAAIDSGLSTLSQATNGRTAGVTVGIASGDARRAGTTWSIAWGGASLLIGSAIAQLADYPATDVGQGEALTIDLISGSSPYAVTKGAIDATLRGQIAAGSKMLLLSNFGGTLYGPLAPSLTGLNTRRNAKVKTPNFIHNGNLDRYGAGVTLFSDLLATPTAYPAKVVARVTDPALTRIGCRYGLFVHGASGQQGNAIVEPMRIVGGYIIASVIVHNSAGTVFDFNGVTGPRVTVRYVNGTSTSVNLSSYEELSPNSRRYYGTILPTAGLPTERIEIGAFSSTTRPYNYIITGAWVSHSDTQALTIEETAYPDWSVTQGRRRGLQALRETLANGLVSPSIVCAPGDSITWGEWATGNSPNTPRDKTLADARDNLDSPTWVNRLRKRIGSLAVGGRNRTEPAPGHGRYRDLQTLDFADAGFRVVDTTTNAMAIKNVADGSGPTNGDYLSLPSGGSYAVGCDIHGDDIRILYGTQTGDASGKFEVYVDGTKVAEASTYAASPTWGNVLNVAMSFGLHRVRILNPSASTSVNLEAIIHNRVAEVINNGIIGTTTVNWARFGVLLAGGVPKTANFIVVQIGTNDRTIVGDTPEAFRRRLEMILRWLNAERPYARIILCCANKALGTAEQDGNPGVYSYSMSDVRRQIVKLARDFDLDFMDQFAATEQVDLDSATVTATVTAGSAVLTNVSNMAVMLPGRPVKGAGIPDQSRVIYASGTSVTMTQNATADGSGVSVRVGSFTDDGLHPNDYGHDIADRTWARVLSA